jgi:hypothetical protein
LSARAYYSGFEWSMARAKIAGAAMRQVSIIAEPPTASNRNDPLTLSATEVGRFMLRHAADTSHS